MDRKTVVKVALACGMFMMAQKEAQSGSCWYADCFDLGGGFEPSYTCIETGYGANTRCWATNYGCWYFPC